ncbi:hypothetical protein FQR65_LT13525 [Abscondita terminalis]|nr:hypothetical protein FQR65_LT13525 [Abscondita terminalis]
MALKMKIGSMIISFLIISNYHGILAFEPAVKNVSNFEEYTQNSTTEGVPKIIQTLSPILYSREAFLWTIFCSSVLTTIIYYGWIFFQKLKHEPNRIILVV